MILIPFMIFPMLIGVTTVQASWSMDQFLASSAGPSSVKSRSFVEQRETEQAVFARFKEMTKGRPSAAGAPPPLLVYKHRRLLLRILRGFPKNLPACFSASIPWVYYWCCHSLDLLGFDFVAEDHAHLRQQILQALHQQCRGQKGGFTGGPEQEEPHVCSSYAAVATLAIVNREPPGWFDLSESRGLLLSIKNKDGSFRTTPSLDSETDARATYCALALARLTGWLDDPEIRRGTAAYLQSSQTCEGGFTGERVEAGGQGGGVGEAHCGYTYCAVAGLKLLSLSSSSSLKVVTEGKGDAGLNPLSSASSKGVTEEEGEAMEKEKGEAREGGEVEDEEEGEEEDDLGINVPGLMRWTMSRQMPFEGGMSGRANKLVDVCYSFWGGSLPALLGKARLLNSRALMRYILGVSQHGLCEGEEGGFADKPGTQPDYYHTCYALSGLSIALHHYAIAGTSNIGRKEKAVAGRSSSDVGKAEKEEALLFPVILREGGQEETQQQGSKVRENMLLPRKVDVSLNLCQATLQTWDKAIVQQNRKKKEKMR